jgi:hypothetical protein
MATDPNSESDTSQTTTTTPPTITPLIGPMMTLLQSRKGSVMLLVLGFCALVYWRDPGKLDKLLAFLTVVLPVWMGAHAWQEGKAGSDPRGEK